MRLGIVITRAGTVEFSWTLLDLLLGALERGHTVRVIERADFEIDATGRLVARAFAFDGPPPRREALLRSLTHRTAARRYVDVSSLDLLLMRSTPLTADLITFAMMAENLGVRVVNSPMGMVAVSSKAWLASRGDVPTPEGLVTRSGATAGLFYEQQQHGVVVKPARGSGGRAVALVPPSDLRRFDLAFSTARAQGGHVVVQAYITAAEQGEKRLLWLDGQIIGGYLRRRPPGEFRHNLKRGGIAEATQVTEAERALLAPLAPHLHAAGIRFAGIDLIGDNIVEVNVVNPGGIYHTDRLSGSDHAGTIIAQLEQPLKSRPSPEHTSWALPVR